MPPDSEAELANALGNRLYREGNFEGAVAAYTSAVQISSSLVAKARGGGGGGGAGAGDDDGGGLKARSKYYANRAQARMQLKDFREAAQDCRGSVEEDPGNAKAFVRWGLCEEALGRWQGALQHFQRACALLPQGTALRKTALDGKRRAETNAAADRKVAHDEAMPEELVHHGQMLRLSFRELLPTECCPGEWFQVSVGLSNEFGLWRRNDFARPSSVTKTTTQGTKPVPASSSCPSSFSGPSLSPAPFSSCLEESEEVWKASLGTETTTAGKLRLVVETRHLEGFGGRSEAGPGQARDGAAERTACSCPPPQAASAPPITSVRSVGGGGEPAQILPTQIFAENDEGLSTRGAAGRKGSSRWVVETDGDSAIGPEGKVSLRVHFVAAPCSDRGDGDSSVSGVGGDAMRNRPLLMLLRVSVIEDEAMALLGRRVVPVLSLPIAVSEVDPRTQGTHGSQVGQEVTIRSKEQTEQSALATNAFNAGAISCREVVFQAAPAATATAAAVSSQRRRLGGGVRDYDRSGSARPDEAAPCKQTSSEEHQGFTERSDDVGRYGCGGDDRGCRGGSSRSGCSGGAGSADGNTAASLEERAVLVAESPGQLGIGGKVWDSAFVLCNYVAKAPTSTTFAAAAAAAAAAAVDAARVRPPSSSPAVFPRTSIDTGDGVRCFASVGGGGGLRAAGGPIDDHIEQEERPRQEETGGRFSASVSGRSAGGSDPRKYRAGGGGGGSESASTPAKLQLRRTRTARGIVEGRRVLELGAGTGLVSVCCALLGASAVIATDFYDVTKLIRLNVSLNFPNTSSYSSQSAVNPLPPPPPPPHPSSNSPRRSLLKSAGAQAAEAPSTTPARSAAAAAAADTATGTATATATTSPPTSTAQATTYPVPACDISASAVTSNDGLELPLTPLPPLPSPRLQSPPVPESQPTAPVTAVPLVWGKKSSEVTRFGAEVVVMSDVVYDPAGYEPLLETLLDVLRPGMIAIMAHRHRHPEDQNFFRRLEQLFHVLEDEEAQPTRDGNPRPPMPAGTEHALENPKTPSGLPRGGSGEQPTRVGHLRPPTPPGTAEQALGDPIPACRTEFLRGGGALRDNDEENENGAASIDDAAREKMTPAPRSRGAVDDTIRVAAATAASAAAAAAAADPAVAAPPVPVAAAVDAAAAAAARVGGNVTNAGQEQERGASNDRGGKWDGADVRIFCIWSRAGKSYE